MIGLNEELKMRESAKNPVRIGLIGAGQMGTDVVAQTSRMPGIEVVAVADIEVTRARRAYEIGQVKGNTAEVHTPQQADEAVQAHQRVFTRDYRVICDMNNIDVVLEATGVPEIGARAALQAMRRGHHLAMMNVETDVTVGPILYWYAIRKGVVYALAAGDEPAACKELYDFADSLGFNIVVLGKGKNNPLNRHAAPTDEEWRTEAARRGLNPRMLIEFVDGTKTMIEMAAVSNATGLIPDVRGMHGPITHREILHQTFALKEDGGVLSRSGVVDYGIGRVAPGVFLVFTTDHPRLRQALVLRDMGSGPYYTLFRPFHLCSIEVPLTCAMMAIWGRSNMHPQENLVSEVFAVSKKTLRAGEILDGIGGATFYGLIDTYETARQENLLPIGLARGAKVTREIAPDTPITYSDVELEESAVLQLRRIQDKWMDKQLVEDEMEAAIDRINREKEE